jgi:hypothetical protein
MRDDNNNVHFRRHIAYTHGNLIGGHCHACVALRTTFGPLWAHSRYRQPHPHQEGSGGDTVVTALGFETTSLWACSRCRMLLRRSG